MAIGIPVTIGAVSSIGTAITTATLTTTANIPSNNLVIVAITVDNPLIANTVASVTDGTNTYAKAYSGNDGNSTVTVEYEIWYCANAIAVSSGATITVVFNIAIPIGGYPYSISAATVSGTATSSPVDQTAAAYAPSGATNVTMTTGSLASSSEIAFGVTTTTSFTATETQKNGFANLSNVKSASGSNTSLDYLIVSSNTAITWNPTWSVSAQMGGALATFMVNSFVWQQTGVLSDQQQIWSRKIDMVGY